LSATLPENVYSYHHAVYNNKKIIIIMTDLYSAFRSEDTEALDAAQEDK